MSAGNGGERESLAPVIPLFGGSVPEARAARARVEDSTTYGDLTDPVDPEESGEAPDAARWHPTWVSARGVDDAAVREDDIVAEEDLAEKALLKRLRIRSLSVSEARALLRERQVAASSIERIVSGLEEYGYLDDAGLADQLVHSAVDRKGQGRNAIAQTLVKRGIPREVADAALATLPDDDAERALEFARSKARSLGSLDRDTALRRLLGQLARRGYGGSVATAAARAALDEAGGSGVRFR
jgi:regulatory protein